MRKFELRAHIYQARDLPPMDDDGLCNPYVVCTMALYLPASPYIALYLPPSPYISLHRPLSPSVSLSLPLSRAISPHLPEQVCTMAGFAGMTRVSEPTCNPQWYQSVV